jgi:chromosome segregation ATPase
LKKKQKAFAWPLLLLVLFFLLVTIADIVKADYLISDEKRIELLSSIKEMKLELNNISEQLENSQINLQQAQQQLTYLKEQYREQIQLSETLQNQSSELKQSLEEWKKLSEDFLRQIKWLKFQRWIYFVLGLAIGKYF